MAKMRRLFTLSQARKMGASNWTIIGGNDSDFAVLLRRLTNFRGCDVTWTCFRSKQGAWAISLGDDVQIADVWPAFRGLHRLPKHLRFAGEPCTNDIGAVPHGEMVFQFDDIAKLEGFLPREFEWWQQETNP